jgi:beta-lactamase superfamily II metal-dependent hydrolase
MTAKDPPLSNEIEVSVFGRGFGESVLVHVGDGLWILVDSLLDQDGTSAPIRYLTDLAVDISKGLRLILATHWHDDHIGGISAAYRDAPDAVLAMPQAMSALEMKAFIRDAARGGSEKISSGVSELQAIATIRHDEGREPFRLAKANNVLLRENALSHGHSVAIEAVSPHDEDVQAFVATLASSPQVRPGQRVMPFEQNDVSVALWISVGPHRLLLGADLENSANVNRGWQAVLNSPAPLTGRASFIKIPHHGSANAHHQPVWNTLLEDQPLAAMTTWNRGRKLPTLPDAKRILALTPRAFVTSSFDRRAARRAVAVERTLGDAGITIRAKQPLAGHIRCRRDLSAASPDWRVDLFNDATKLQSLIALL